MIDGTQCNDFSATTSRGQRLLALQVVHEQLEELVFSEPLQAFHQRVSNKVAVPAPPYSIAQQFTTFAPAAEVQRYNAVRQKVAQMRAHMQRQLDLVN